MRERATLNAVSALMSRTRWAVVATVFVAGLIGLATPAQAQLKTLDEGDKYSRFVQALRERGMTSVLRHYIDAHPPKDPVVKLEVDIEIAKADFQDDKKDVTERASAALLALDLYRQIIKSAPQDWNWKRPIWRTDMAEWAFEGVLALRYVYAGDFVEFGVTTIEQRTIFDQLAAENYASMEEAANELFLLQLNLPKRNDFNEQFVNTGRWQQIKEVYGNIKTPFRRAWTVLYATLMEVPQGQDKIEEAYDQLQQVANQTLNDSGKAQVHSLLGRLATARGIAMLAKGPEAKSDDKDKKDKKPAGPSRDAQKQLQAAIKHLDEAINVGKDYPVVAMVATLAKAKALNAAGQGAAAISLLEPFSAVDPAKSNPMMLILLYDARVVMSGDKSHYNKLFQEPAAQPWKGEIQQYIAQREVKDPEKVDPLKDAPLCGVFECGPVESERRSGEGSRRSQRG